MTARGLVVKERSSAETFVSCDELYVNLGTLSAVRMAPVLKEVKIEKPYLRIVRNRDFSYNFSDLMVKSDSKPLKFALNNIRIEKGSIDFVDLPVEKKHTVRDLTIGIPFISNIPSYVERFVQPHFSAKIDDALYSFTGQTKPFADSLETYLDVNVKDFDLPYYMAYVPVKTDFKLLSGSMDLGARISFVETKGKKTSLKVSGSLSLKQVALSDEKQQPFFQLPLLGISIAQSEPLSGLIHLSSVTIESPALALKRDESGRLNIQPLLSMKGGAEPAPPKTEATLSLDIDEILLKGGKFSFSDLSGSKPFTTVLDSTELKVDHFATGKEKKVDYLFSAQTEAKESLKAEGQFSLDPLWSEGTLNLASVPLKKYAPYYGNKLLFSVEDGHLDFSTRYRYAAGEKEPEVLLSELAASVGALRLRKADDKADFLKIPALSVSRTDVDLTGKLLHVGSFSTEKGEVLIGRSAAGEIDILNLIRPEPRTNPLPGPKAVKKTVPPEKPWLISVDQVLVDKYAVQMSDSTTGEPVRVSVQNLRLKAENISTAKNNKARVAISLLLNKKGSFSVSGTLGVTPLSANLKVGAKGIEIAPFQPYFADRVRMTVTGGAFSTNGNLAFGQDKGGQVNLSYGGDASLSSFSSVDKTNGEDLVKLESLSLSGLGVRLAPLSIAVKGVSLTNFYSLVSVSREGKINLQEMLASEGSKAQGAPSSQAASAPQKQEAPTAIAIDQVTLQGGRIDFLDQSVNPQFSAHLSEMGGRVSGLSADQNTAADVELRGKLDDYAPLEITGKINPLRTDLLVDLKAKITDLDLSPASPYSGKYAGYAIEKGKLSLDVKYSINGRKLDSQNSLFIDQFNFGQRVESPQATKLPVRLAVALLKDRTGKIDLELPVAGSLDDPKFSVWKIVLKIIVNLITKAATSPFALLGAAFGGGEELSNVEFDYGSAIVTEPSMKKIATLAKALQDRPSLKLDIEGHVDMEKDREGLKQLLFNRKIKAQKLTEMTKKGGQVPPVDEVTIEPAEREKYLKMAYKAEKFPKPKNFLGMAKEIPVPEMEKLILTHTEVTDGDLRSLASQRALNVRDALLKSGKVEPERIFIVEPKTLAPEKKEKAKESRVDFRLK